MDRRADRHARQAAQTRETYGFARRRAFGILAVLVIGGSAFLAAWTIEIMIRAVLPAGRACWFLALLASSLLAQKSLFDHVRSVADGLSLACRWRGVPFR